LFCSLIWRIRLACALVWKAEKKKIRMSSSKDEICSLCGKAFDLSINQFYLLRSQPNDKQPFFPFLETFSRNGQESYESCLSCSQSLINQWNEFEKKAIPINKRIYWLNNRAFGPPPGGGLNCTMFSITESPHVIHSKRLNLDNYSSTSSSHGVLDLSCSSKSDKAIVNCQTSQEDKTSSRAAHSWSPISVKNYGKFVFVAIILE